MSDQGPEIWTVDRTELMADCRIFTVERRHSRSATKQGSFFAIQSKDWVNVVPVTAAGEIVLVEQFRHGTGQISLEIPGGIVDGTESIIDAGLRELREETGYSGEARFLGTVAANPAFMTNRFSAIAVDNAVLTDPTAFDEHEDIRILLTPLAELPDLLRRGAIQNAYTVLALSWFLLGYGPQA